jgi:hypothetical protein
VNIVSIHVPASQRKKVRSEVLEKKREMAYADFAPVLYESKVYSDFILFSFISDKLIIRPLRTRIPDNADFPS